jgi:choline oxidase
LLLSGIGPAEEISPHGIQVVLDLPGVGRRLTDHPEAAVIWTSSRPVPGAEEGAWVNALFARTDSGLEAPDVMIHFGTDVYQFASSLDVGPPPAPRGQSFCMTPNVPRPRSEGSIRLRAADPAVGPIVDPRYFTDPDGYDEEILLRGVELAREVVRHEPLASWVDTELWPAATDRRQLSERVRGSAGTVFHLAASARMGAPNDADAVVDPQLRVRGIDGLRIADASVFPRMVGVNPAMTCMMIGERCADLIAGDA